jgi:thiamine-phosphate pyrophosphorylase
LHLITDTRYGRDPLAILPAALAAGVDVVQVRAKAFGDREVYLMTERIVALCNESGAICVVNDRLDVAMAAGAAGTHLGDEDLPVEASRRIAGPDFILGVTARNSEGAAAAVAAGASYLGVGPSFATSTKEGLPPPIGAEGVAAVCRAVSVPVVAIGGVTAERVPALIEAGAHGVAVVDAVYGAADPIAAVRGLRAALDSVCIT